VTGVVVEGLVVVVVEECMVFGNDAWWDDGGAKNCNSAISFWLNGSEQVLSTCI